MQKIKEFIKQPSATLTFYNIQLLYSLLLTPPKATFQQLYFLIILHVISQKHIADL